MAALEVGDVVYVKEMRFYTETNAKGELDVAFGDLYIRAIVLSKPIRLKFPPAYAVHRQDGHCECRYLAIVGEKGPIGYPQDLILTEIPEDARGIS